MGGLLVTGGATSGVSRAADVDLRLEEAVWGRGRVSASEGPADACGTRARTLCTALVGESSNTSTSVVEVEGAEVVLRVAGGILNADIRTSGGGGRDGRGGGEAAIDTPGAG